MIIFVIVAAVLAVIGYVVYKKYKGAKAAPSSASAAGTQAAVVTGKPVVTVISSSPVIQQHSTTTRA